MRCLAAVVLCALFCTSSCKSSINFRLIRPKCDTTARAVCASKNSYVVEMTCDGVPVVYSNNCRGNLVCNVADGPLCIPPPDSNVNLEENQLREDNNGAEVGVRGRAGFGGGGAGGHGGFGGFGGAGGAGGSGGFGGFGGVGGFGGNGGLGGFGGVGGFGGNGGFGGFGGVGGIGGNGGFGGVGGFGGNGGFGDFDSWYGFHKGGNGGRGGRGGKGRGGGGGGGGGGRQFTFVNNDNVPNQ